MAPTVNAGANQIATAGSAFTFSATFSDAGVNDAPWAYTITWGDGSSQTTGSTSSQTNPITATHTYAAGGTDTLRLTVTDKDGGAGSGKIAVTVTTGNRPPTAVAGGPYSGTEGAAVSFDGSGSSDPDGDALTYAWTFGDGSSGTGVKPSHSYANNGSYTVTLTVTDSRGAASSPATTTATIANAAPVVNAGANQTATAGTAFTFSATFSDAGVNDAPWAYAITWGDGSSQTTGSTSSQSSPITATHTYTAAGTDTLRLTVTDKDGGAGSGKIAVTVSPPGAALFADDFETGGCPCWRPVQGSWAVVLDSGTNHGYRNTNTSGSDWSYAGDTTWTDYAVQAQVKLITWASSGGIARVFARYQPGTWGSYYAGLNGSGAVILRKRVGSSDIDLAPPKAIGATLGQWYTLRLEVVGTTLKAYVNGTLQLTATDGDYARGTIAVGGWNNVSLWDNVQVTKLP